MNYINLMGLNIPTYGLMIIIGLAIGNVAAGHEVKRRKMIIEDLIIIEAYGLSFGAIGAKVVYLLINIDTIQWNKLFNINYFNSLMRSGFVFYGGLIGGFIGLFVAWKIHKINVKTYLFNLIFSIPLVHGFGRIGCFFAGCCYGIPYNGLFSVKYHNISYSLNDINLFPVQLVEAICLFILALFLYFYNKKRQADINATLLYLVFYSIIRFFIEFFRYDKQRGSIGVLSTSQIISIIILIIVLIIKRLNKNNAKFIA